ncbi:MAG: zinc ribbon domain-containing protein [Promethearchaeota archaeon]
MTEVKDYIWICPFIGSIIAVIGLFTPAAALSLGVQTHLYWMHGFYLIVGGGSHSSGFYTGIPAVLGIGISCTIILTVCTIIMFISSLTHRGKKTPSSWLALGILFIIGTIVFIAGVESASRMYGLINYGYPISFWQNRTPSFAVIAPFIAGALAILGFIIGRTAREGEVEIIPVSKDLIPESKELPRVDEEISPPVSASIEEIHFCPECGQKIASSDSKFCPSCGFEFRKIY